jgi:hypothetical protein
MEDVYYLVHQTNKDPEKIKTLRKNPSCKDSIDDQFPGVFFTLVTKYNIETEHYYGGKYTLIFSKDLLKQNNYHINIKDNNGNISEHNTYYPWNIDEAVKQIKILSKSKNMSDRMNEVVFHDAIDMKYCCKVIEKPTFKTDEEAMNFIVKGGIRQLLPRKPMKTNQQPDMTKIPFYSWTFGDMSELKIPKSSLTWFKMLTKVANIDKPCKSKQECIEAIKEKIPYLCKNRHLQNIEILKEFTENK